MDRTIRLQPKNLSYEIIFVDDGSTDHSWQVIEELSRHGSKCQRDQIPPELRQIGRTEQRIQSCTG
ncbi:MAG: glycosyltransferase [Marinilabiliales bacterium]|nr:glycosyltransferase [Marinilabiliales bacterium]